MMSKKARSGLALGIGLSGICAHAAINIGSVDFKQSGGKSVLEIRGDGSLSNFEKHANSDDKQIVVDLKGAKLTKGTSRKLDTSSFDSKVMLVSPYQVGEDARVVLQLRESADAEVISDGNTLRIEVPLGAAAVSAPAASGGGVDSGSSSSVAASSNLAAETVARGTKESASGEKKDLMDQYLGNRESKKFTGRAISLKLNDADVRDVLRLIGEASGFNLVISDEVTGKITLALEDVPWDQALDVVLQTKQLSAERAGNLLRISSVARFTAEKQQELQARLIGQANSPFVTRVFPINYAKTAELSALILKFLQGLRPTGVANPAQGVPAVLGVNVGVRDAVVQVDTRSNSLIIQDTAENTERARKIIELLDVQPAQVLIEGKIIEASETWGRAMQGQLGFVRSGVEANKGIFYASGNYGDLSSSLLGTSGTGAGALDSTATGVSGFGINPGFTIIRGATLRAILSVAESESKVKVMASPRAVVMNQESVSITSGQTVLLPTISQGAGGNISGFTEKTANLSMTVSPTVTNEGSIVLQLTLQRDVPNGNTVNPRNISTKVLVDSGSTLVLGGIYSEQENESSSGMPFLRKIPILGKLFGVEGSGKNRTELFFFITPKILNAKEAGLTAG